LTPITTSADQVRSKKHQLSAKPVKPLETAAIQLAESKGKQR